MRQSGWTVFIAYAFADRLFAYKLNGTEFQTWKQVWIADEQQNRIPHLQVPIEILQLDVGGSPRRLWRVGDRRGEGDFVWLPGRRRTRSSGGGCQNP